MYHWSDRYTETKQTSKIGYGKLHIFDSTEAATERHEYQSNQGCLAEVIQMQDEMLRQVNQFVVT
jgi:hypothetical protein